LHFENRQRDDSESSVLPLINVVFLLLIFFMIAGSFGVIDPFQVNAPQSASEGQQQAEAIQILLSRDGRLALDGNVIDEEALLTEITERYARDASLRLQLKADAGVAGNRVVLLMERLHDAGVGRLRLMTLPAAR
jgi:biopolymer transport protein ExbD